MKIKYVAKSFLYLLSKRCLLRCEDEGGIWHSNPSLTCLYFSHLNSLSVASTSCVQAHVVTFLVFTCYLDLVLSHVIFVEGFVDV